jgi:hypothetical protein
MTGPARLTRSRRSGPWTITPSPAELWAHYRQWKNLAPAEEQIVLQDYHDDGSGKEPRHVLGFSLIFSLSRSIGAFWTLSPWTGFTPLV